MHTKVTLRADRNEFYIRSAKDPEGGWVKRKVITAQGYARLNNWLGVTFASPPTQQIGERVVGNPYLERDGSSVLRVTVRRIGIGRTAAGSLTAVDLTVTYDLDDYLIGEIWSAWQPTRRNPKAKSWGKLFGGLKGVSSEASQKVIECPGGVFLVVDLNDSEVLSLWSAHLQRQKFAERNAVSICERNILKRFVGAAYANDDCTVDVVHWSQPDRNVKQWDEIARRVQAGEARIEGMDVQVQQSAEIVSSEDAVEALHGEGEESPEFAEAEEDGELSLEETISVARHLWGDANKQQRDAALKAAGFNAAKDVMSCGDKAKVTSLVEALEAAMS